MGQPVTQAVITVPAYFNDAQRQATKDAGTDRRPRGASASSTSPPLRLWPTASTRSTMTRRSSSSTWAAARSTCPSWRWATAWLRRCAPPLATTTWAATTGTSASSTGWSTKFKAENGIDLCQGHDGPAASEGSRREGEDGAVLRHAARTSTCPSSPPTASGPKHLDYTLTRAEFERITKDLLDRVQEAGP